MRTLNIGWLIASAALFAAIPGDALAQSRKPNEETSFIYEEQGWKLLVDHTTDDGCYIFKASPSMNLRVQHDPASGRVYMMLISHRWKSLDTGKFYPLTFRFDENPNWDVNAKATDTFNAPTLTFFVDDKEFLEEMASSRFVTFVTGEKLVGSFDLSGSARALRMLSTCKEEMEKSKDPFADSQNMGIPPPIIIPKKPKPPDDPFGT